MPPSWRVASNRNQVRRSVSSMKFSRMLALATSPASSADLVRLAHAAGELLVVLHQLAQHLAWRDVVLVVVLDGLELGDLADRLHVVPPILRTRSASWSVVAKIWSDCSSSSR